MAEQIVMTEAEAEVQQALDEAEQSIERMLAMASLHVPRSDATLDEWFHPKPAVPQEVQRAALLSDVCAVVPASTAVGTAPPTARFPSNRQPAVPPPRAQQRGSQGGRTETGRRVPDAHVRHLRHARPSSPMRSPAR